MRWELLGDFGLCDDGEPRTLDPIGECSSGQQQKTILVVDDDEGMRKSLSARLKSEGYGVALASDGPSAISAAISESPDLILLDLGLPTCDGISVLGRLSDHPRTISIPVIVVSGNRIPAMRAQAFDLGARAFIQKPFEGAELLRTVEEQIDLLD